MYSFCDCLIVFVMPFSEYFWAVMVLYLTNLNYIDYLEQNPLIPVPWTFHIPQEVYFGILGAGGGFHLMLLIVCYRRKIKNCK